MFSTARRKINGVSNRSLGNCATVQKALSLSMISALSAITVCAQSGLSQSDHISGATQTASSVPPSASPAANPSPQDKVMRTLATLRIASEEGQHISRDIDEINKYLQDTMIQVSQPVWIPAMETAPLELATPDPKLYSGHFREARSKTVVVSIQKINTELAIFVNYLKSLYIPENKRSAVKSLVDDINTTMSAIQSSFGDVQKNIQGQSTIDAEMIEVKLSNMQKDLTTVDHDLKTIFQIINLKDASQATMDGIASARVLGRNAHWLGRAAQYLHDNARELNPDAAIIHDAQVQGWLTFGTPTGGYKALNKNPYQPLKSNTVIDRMTELGEYVNAVKTDIDTFPSPTDKSSSIKQIVSQMQKLSGSIEDSFNKLHSLTHTTTYDTGAIAKEADSIKKDAIEIGKLDDKLSNELLKGQTVL